MMSSGELDVKIGDTVEVALDSFEDGYGESRLSREKAKRARAWTRLEEAQQADEIVTGRFTGKVKGGFTVDIGEIRAFLPGSLVDVRPVRDTAYLEEKELEFKIIKLDQKRNNVVVSRRAVVEKNSAKNVKNCSKPSRKANAYAVSSRILPITVHSSTSVVSTVCCTSPTWPGSGSSIRLKWLKSVRKSTSWYSSSIVKRTASPWV